MRQIKVFIIDDEAESVERIALMLKNNPGVRLVGGETDPVRAISLIMSNRPDLIFLDIEMPGTDGFAILGSIRENGYNPGIIFVSGYDKYAIRAIKESAQDYILKPVDPCELEQAIDRYISNFRKDAEIKEDFSELLTDREVEVFGLLQTGNSSKQIAATLNISKNTVDTHRRRILKKLNLTSTKQIFFKYPVRK